MVNKTSKPVHAKPSLYAHYYEILKKCAKKYGYNLLLHGSMNRDLDLVAIPWAKEFKPHELMIKEFCILLNGEILPEHRTGNQRSFKNVYHGREVVVINLNRNCFINLEGQWTDPQYYIDISIIPLGVPNEMIT